MKKHGFTLIELLAVIVLLAALMVFAVPNVMKIYEKSRNNIFIADAQTIYEEVLKQHELDRAKYISNNHYCYDGENNINKLDLSGVKDLYYNAVFEGNKMISFEISNSNASIIIQNTNGIEKSDITLNLLKTKNETEYEIVTCI